MYKKLMVTVLAVMAVGVAQDCDAARGARAQSIREQVERAAKFDIDETLRQAHIDQCRAKTPSTKIARAAKAAKKRAERSQLVKAVHEKHALIDAIRKNLDKQAR